MHDQVQPKPVIGHEAIAALLRAMGGLIEKAKSDVILAQEHVVANEQNAAIGALMPIEQALTQSLALYHAVIAIHRSRL